MYKDNVHICIPMHSRVKIQYGYVFIQVGVKVQYGYWLPPQPGCPKNVYQLMMKFW